jgi:uncharacterized membrane protein YjgN (DUF898 family)
MLSEPGLAVNPGGIRCCHVQAVWVGFSFARKKLYSLLSVLFWSHVRRGWQRSADRRWAPRGGNMEGGESVWGPGTVRKDHITFTGNASEYFRIWVVNTLLIIVTLGVYLPWAKARTRRYFSRNTFLNGQHFDYLTRPKLTLAGHMIVISLVLIYTQTKESFNIIFPRALSYSEGGFLMFLTCAFIPWLIYKTIHFRVQNTSYRGIHFHFLGTAKESYKVYGLLLGPLFLLLFSLIPIFLFVVAISFHSPNVGTKFLAILSIPGSIVLGLYPYYMFRRWRYVSSNIAFGSSSATSNSRLTYFYFIYIKSMVIGLVMCIIITFVVVAIIAITKLIPEDSTNSANAAIIIIIPTVIILLAYSFFEPYVYASLTNHCWNNLQIGPISFQAKLETKEFRRLRLTNALAIVLSLGFLTPWAVIRQFKYITSRFSVSGVEELNSFVAAETPKG